MFAFEHRRIKTTLRRTVNEAVSHSIARVARLESSGMDEGIFGRGDVAGLVLVNGLGDPQLPNQLVGSVVHGCARDDPVVVGREALGFHQALPSTRRAPIPIRESWPLTVEGNDEGFCSNRHFMNGAVAVVHQLFRMAWHEARTVPHVSRIGGGGHVSLCERCSEGGYPMTPAHPPFPTDCSLPFHFESGSQTSILMSESLEGARVAVTRQKAGRAENCKAAVAGPPGIGGVKAPTATAFADVIVVFGSLTEARLSHDAARTGKAVRVRIATPAKHRRIFLAAID